MKYSFADCTLDTERRELHRRGTAVALRPKVFQVLTYLVRNAERVISKEELYEQIWTGRVVGDATLNSCLKEARRAIGDSGESQRILRTLHGQGYRFVAPVFEAEDPTPAEAPRDDSQRPHDEADEAAAGVTPGREFKSVSVLAVALDRAGELAGSLGAEATDVLLRTLFEQATEVVSAYQGTVTEWLDDGFTALFGAPAAVEDHARCAALAALALIERSQSVRALRGTTLNVGLHTGRVLIGALDGGGPLFTAVGDTTGVARALKHRAHGEILASLPLFSLIEAEFRAAASGTDAMRLEALVQERGGVPLRATRRVSRFVGRDQELAILERRLELASSGAGQAIGIRGEPGIGKSRLVTEFHNGIAAHRARAIKVQCLAYRAATPYFPLTRLIGELCGLADDARATQIATSLGGVCAAAGIDDGDDVALLLALLDADSDQRAIPDQHQNRVFNLVSRLLLHTSQAMPCVILIEDVHWMDATSGEWLDRLVKRVDAARVLLIATYRPDYRAAWTRHSSVSQIALPRLTDSDSAALVGSLAGGSDVTPALRQRIVSQAQGNPFFLEELTWSLAAGADTDAAAVPTTVQAVLAARIDQLQPSDKALLQTAAVIGTPVPEALLHVVVDDRDLEEALVRLEDAELLYREDGREGMRLRFKHALTREVAYESLLSSTRRELHRRIAELYEGHFKHIADRHPELVARHYTEAGVSQRAFDYWRAAGAAATRRSANPEAVVHYSEALRIAETLPETDERRRQELDVYLQLGPPLMASEGFSAPAVAQSYRRALALCDAVGSSRERFPVLWGLWMHHAHRGDIEESRTLTAELLTLAEGLQEAEFQLQAHHAAWTTALWHEPDVTRCRDHALAGVDIYEQDVHHMQLYRYGGHDAGVCARGTAGIACWFAGYPDQALTLIRAGAELADRTGHPYSRLISRNDFLLVHMLRGEVDETHAAAEETLALCEELSIPNYLAESKIFLGLCRARLEDDPEPGLALVQEGVDEYRAGYARRNLGFLLLFLAETCLVRSRPAPGLAAATEAAELIEITGEVRWAPETLRLRGELMRNDGVATDAVEALFQQALALTIEQNARAFQLRAATSLARVWLHAGKGADARAMLQSIYDTFTEGRQTRDLREARAVLDDPV